MPFNGAGTFQPLPPPQFPAVVGEVIRAAYFNTVINDILAGLTNTLTRDGQSPPTNNLPMAGKKFTGVADATASDEFTTKNQLSGTATGQGSELVGAIDSGTGAVARTSAAVLRERKSVVNYLAATDTDLTSAITKAIASAGSACKIYFPDRNDLPQVTTGEITLTVGKEIWIEGSGYQLTHAGTGNVFVINNSSSSLTDPQHVIAGIVFSKAVAQRGQGTAVKITDSQEQHLRDCVFQYYSKGVQLINTAIWTEGTELENLGFYHCDTAIELSKGSSGVASLAGTQFKGINVFSMFGAASATPRGIALLTNASIYRASFLRCLVFIDKTNSTGFYCDGDMSSASGSLHFENTRAGITGEVSIALDTNATGLNVNLWSDIRDTIAGQGKPTITGSKVLQGWEVGNRGSAVSIMRKAGVAGYLRGVVNEDLTTSPMLERLTGGDAYQWRAASYTNPPEFRDDSGGFVMPLRAIPVGSGTTDITTGTTPSCKGLSTIRLNYAGATNITNFTNAFDEQVIDLVSLTVFPTLVHNNVVGGIVMKSGANYTFTVSATKRLKFIIDRWFEI